MTNKRTGQRLAISLIPLGTGLLVVGMVLGNAAQVGIGAIGIVLGAFFYAFIRRTPTDKLHYSGKRTLSSSLLQIFGNGTIFAIAAYLATEAGITTWNSLVTAPSSLLPTVSAIFLASAVSGVNPLLAQNTRNRAVERIISQFPMLIFVGLLVIAPTMCLLYAMAFFVTQLGVYGYSRT